MVERHMHHEAREKQTKNIDTPEYRQAMRARQIWCEGNFSHQKERHNLRRTRKRGIEKVTEQCLLSACALNLKRLVAALKVRTSTNLKYWVFIRLVLSKRIFLLFQRFVNSANSDSAPSCLSLQCRADDRCKLRVTRDDEIHPEQTVARHFLKDLTDGRERRQIARQHDLFEPEAARRKDRHHSDRFADHIGNAERDIRIRRHIAELAEV